MNTAGSGLSDVIENLPVLSLNPETALSDRNASPYGAINLLFQKSRTQMIFGSPAEERMNPVPASFVKRRRQECVNR
jgi:hypothetical protein